MNNLLYILLFIFVIAFDIEIDESEEFPIYDTEYIEARHQAGVLLGCLEEGEVESLEGIQRTYRDGIKSELWEAKYLGDLRIVKLQEAQKYYQWFQNTMNLYAELGIIGHETKNLAITEATKLNGLYWYIDWANDSRIPGMKRRMYLTWAKQHLSEEFLKSGDTIPIIPHWYLMER